MKSKNAAGWGVPVSEEDGHSVCIQTARIGISLDLFIH
jgi:hypothetical protein